MHRIFPPSTPTVGPKHPSTPSYSQPKTPFHSLLQSAQNTLPLQQSAQNTLPLPPTVSPKHPSTPSYSQPKTPFLSYSQPKTPGFHSYSQSPPHPRPVPRKKMLTSIPGSVLLNNFTLRLYRTPRVPRNWSMILNL